MAEDRARARHRFKLDYQAPPLPPFSRFQCPPHPPSLYLFITRSITHSVGRSPSSMGVGCVGGPGMAQWSAQEGGPRPGVSMWGMPVPAAVTPRATRTGRRAVSSGSAGAELAPTQPPSRRGLWRGRRLRLRLFGRPRIPGRRESQRSWLGVRCSYAGAGGLGHAANSGRCDSDECRCEGGGPPRALRFQRHACVALRAATAPSPLAKHSARGLHPPLTMQAGAS